VVGEAAGLASGEAAAVGEGCGVGTGVGDGAKLTLGITAGLRASGCVPSMPWTNTFDAMRPPIATTTKTAGKT